MYRTKILILAGGKGTRMGNDYPKVLTKLLGKPMISYLLEELVSLSADFSIGIVVGYRADLVKEVLGNQYDYYFQKEQLGSGHAVHIAQLALKKERIDRLVVLYGDHPYIKAKSVQELLDLEKESGAELCMATTKVDDFSSWRRVFLHWGRILRNENGEVIAIREYRDCSEEEMSITELNPGIYCFHTYWLWQNIGKLNNYNSQGEYYLTDLAEIAIRDGKRIPTISIEPKECVGINTQKELRLAQSLAEK